MDNQRRRLMMSLPFATPVLARSFPNGVRESAGPDTTLTIGGAVRRPLTISAVELRCSPLATNVPPIPLTSCTGQLKRVLSAYRGVRLIDLLDQAQITEADHRTARRTGVVLRASDGYAVLFSWSELYKSSPGDDVLILFERNARALDAREGPFASIAPADLRTGPRHVRGLRAIDVVGT